MNSKQGTQTSCFVNNGLYSLVSSEPLKVMLCNENNDTSKGKNNDTSKGGPLKVYASDQVGNPVAGDIYVCSNTVNRVQCRVTHTGNQCTEVDYSMFPQDNLFLQLELYIYGPCYKWEPPKQVNVSAPCPSKTGILCDEYQQGLSFVLHCRFL